MSDKRQPLSLSELSQRMPIVPQWSVKDNALVRVFKYENYLDGLDFVNRIAQEADRADHHPAISLEFGKVTVSFSTHSAGGVTAMDFEAARAADNLALSL